MGNFGMCCDEESARQCAKEYMKEQHIEFYKNMVKLLKSLVLSFLAFIIMLIFVFLV